MADLGNREEIKRKTDEDPDINRIKDAHKQTLSDLSEYINQTNINHETRNEIWANQNVKTGRKHGSETNPVHPWEDASDIRPFTVNTIIDEDVALLVESLENGNLLAVPVEGNDTARGTMISQFMKWMIFQQFKEFNREATILANYQEEKGIGILAVLWDTRTEEKLQEIKIEDILAIDPENPQVGEDLLAMIQDKDLAKDASAIIQRIFPTINKRKGNKIVKELRENGNTFVGIPDVIWNRPVIKALSVDENFFFSPNIENIQDAPYVFHSEYLTPEQLRAKIRQGWNKKWVEKAIEMTIGKTTEHHINTINSASNTFEQNLSVDVAKGFIRVTHAYEKATTEDGVPGIFITSFHPDLEGFGQSHLLNYKPSRYPFVDFPREYRSRRLMDVKSAPELAKGYSDEIKVQMDSRVDRTTLATCPPRYHALGRKPSNWGPGDSLGVRRRDETGFMEIPPFDQGSVQIENDIRDNLSRMFGRPVDEQNAAQANRMQQNKVNRWLKRWVEVMNQVWDLHQQFGDDEEFFRVIGSVNPEPMQFIRASENERFDFYFNYNVINSDSEALIGKLKTAGEILTTFDPNGTSDMDEYKKLVLSAIDPSYPDRLVKPLQTATMEEVRKTQDDIAKISSGQSVNVPENANPELRIEVLESYFKGTEDIPAEDVQRRLQDEPEFQARMKKYGDQLQFIITQRENANIGRMGTQPGNALPSQ